MTLTDDLHDTAAALRSGWPIANLNRARRVRASKEQTVSISIESNADVDAFVVKAISLSSVPIRAGKIGEMVAEAAGVKSNQAMRPVDRSIQRLRRAGSIRLVTGPGGGWVLP